MPKIPRRHQTTPVASVDAAPVDLRPRPRRQLQTAAAAPAPAPAAPVLPAPSPPSDARRLLSLMRDDVVEIRTSKSYRDAPVHALELVRKLIATAEAALPAIGSSFALTSIDHEGSSAHGVLGECVVDASALRFPLELSTVTETDNTWTTNLWGLENGGDVDAAEKAYLVFAERDDDALLHDDDEHNNYRRILAALAAMTYVLTLVGRGGAGRVVIRAAYNETGINMHFPYTNMDVTLDGGATAAVDDVVLFHGKQHAAADVETDNIVRWARKWIMDHAPTDDDATRAFYKAMGDKLSATDFAMGWETIVEPRLLRYAPPAVPELNLVHVSVFQYRV
jgi:hypothetical protein